MKNSYNLGKGHAEIEVSVVLPCLNEAKTIGICVEKALHVFRESKIKGEVIVVDNGSTDNSIKIAKEKGAKVLIEPRKGPGFAYLKGYSAANGQIIVISDSDNTYDFLEMPKLLEPLMKKETDFVLGTRLKGKIHEGAMVFSHYIANILQSGMFRLLFKNKISDEHSGFRAFTKDALKKMDLKCGGFDYTIEMLVRAIQKNLRIKEVPISYYPREGESKVTIKDAWKHMRFMMLFAPSYTFLLPGFLLLLLGFGINILLLGGPFIFHGISFDLHPAVFASMIAIVGYELLLMGIYAKKLAVRYGFEHEKKFMRWFSERINLEKGILIGLLIFMLGFFIDLNIIYKWVRSGFGAIFEMKAALFALTFIVIGIQTMFSSWFLSMLEIEKIY